MNTRKLGVLFTLLVAFATGMFAQSTTSLRINEVLITNESNYQDDYGVHSAWIEIFNNSYASVDLKGCFLTNDKNNPTKYPIPKVDVLTLIKPRQHTLFWADGKPERGTFHVSFTLDPTIDNYIALYDSNGKTLIDEVTIPANTLAADQSYARIFDGKDTDSAADWEVRGNNGKYVTPSTNNVTIDKNEKIEKFKEHDKSGVGMSITAMSVVFFGLLVLFLAFKFVGVTAMKFIRRKEMKASGITSVSEAKDKGMGKTSGEVYAAIAMALHEMQNDVHDVEDTVLTISKVKRIYSPWSSKIYTLRETPKRK